jgi:hypothetical protein
MSNAATADYDSMQDAILAHTCINLSFQVDHVCAQVLPNSMYEDLQASNARLLVRFRNELGLPACPLHL